MVFENSDCLGSCSVTKDFFPLQAVLFPPHPLPKKKKKKSLEHIYENFINYPKTVTYETLVSCVAIMQCKKYWRGQKGEHSEFPRADKFGDSS